MVATCRNVCILTCLCEEDGRGERWEDGRVGCLTGEIVSQMVACDGGDVKRIGDVGGDWGEGGDGVGGDGGGGVEGGKDASLLPFLYYRIQEFCSRPPGDVGKRYTCAT